MGRRLLPVTGQVPCAVNKSLVNTVNMDIFRGGIVQINGEYERGDALILRHARRRDIEPRPRMVGGVIEGDGLLCLKKPGAGRHADSLERRRDRQADRLVRARLVRYQKPRLEWVESAGDTFYRGVIGFEINANADTFIHCSSPCARSCCPAGGGAAASGSFSNPWRLRPAAI